MSYDWFPLGLATGKAFCNRVQERGQLADNFDKARHSLLVSPRRYGKTSLVMQSIRDSKRAAIKIDFFTVTSVQAAAERILSGISLLIPKMETKAEKAIRLAKEFFKRFHISLEYKDVGFSIGMKPIEQNVVETIVSALRGLEKIAKKTGKDVVLFLDEVQAVGLLKNNIMVEGAIREAAQEAKHVAYVFSGSHRRLLSRLFDDSSRPLYLLCQRIGVERIHVDAYFKHFQKAAKDKWGTKIDDNVISDILALTERHPYYVNALASRLWSQDKKPTNNSVKTNWLAFAEEESSRVSGDLDKLTLNQRKLLIAIARAGEVKEPSSRAFLTASGLSSASLLQAIKALEEKDYVEKTKSGMYFLIDPMIKRLMQ